MPRIAPALPADLEEVRALFREYALIVREALSVQGFEAELAGLPGAYAPPAGALLLARDAEGPAGCVALRTLPDGSAEMKRLYVRERCRGSGLGRRLALAVIDEARRAARPRIVLDTLPKLGTAIALYRDLGFREIPPYLAAPTPGALCFGLSLS